MGTHCVNRPITAPRWEFTMSTDQSQPLDGNSPCRPTNHSLSMGMHCVGRPITDSLWEYPVQGSWSLMLGFMKSYRNISAAAVWVDSTPNMPAGTPEVPAGGCPAASETVHVIDCHWIYEASVHAAEKLPAALLRTDARPPLLASLTGAKCCQLLACRGLRIFPFSTNGVPCVENINPNRPAGRVVNRPARRVANRPAGRVGNRPARRVANRPAGR
eukprot:1074946-Prorocentrum_minimum.AAC.1